MRRRLVGYVVVASVVSAAGAVGWAAHRAAEAEELVAEARARLDASLVEAPELDRVQASTAVSLLERAAALGRDDAESAALAHRAAAIVDLQRGDLILAEGELGSARRRGGWTPELRVIAAEIARRRTDLDAAGVHVEEALSDAPRDPRALQLAADLALDRGDANHALAKLAVLAELEPNAASVHNRLGVAHLELGDDRASERALRRALELDPRDADAWVNLGRVMRRRGEHDAARDAFDAAIEHARGRSDAHLGRGLARAALHDLDGAVADFTRAAELAPNDAEPLLALGDLLRDVGRLDEAIETYREALAREDADAASWLKLGNALVLAREATHAATAFREAVRRAPELAAAHNGLGAALMASGDHDAASESLARAAELDARDPNPLMNLALLRERTGDRVAARSAWQAALERDPDSAIARARLARLGG